MFKVFKCKNTSIFLGIMVHKAKHWSVIKQACVIVCYDCTIITTHNMCVKFKLSAFSSFGNN